MAKLKEHGLIVSCQAVKGEPLYGLHMMGHFARAAVLGGATGIRANYVEDINEITAEVDVPVIGIIKAEYPDSEVYITPTLKEVKALLTTKCSVIALDATKRARPNGEKLGDLIKYIRDNAPEVEIMADCSNYEEAKRADELGFDYIGTTLRGYTEYTKGIAIPDCELLRRIYSLLAAHKELNLKTLILYTTRPIRVGEQDGKNYYFVDDGKLEEFRKNGNLIEERAYHTVYGIWTYFTADDGQVNLADSDYLGIGTLESFKKMRKYYGEDAVCPVYVQVEDGERLSRALNREREQENPRYEEMCRRFIADQSDFSEENILNAGIEKRFQNINLDDCVKEIANYIKSVQ